MLKIINFIRLITIRIKNEPYNPIQAYDDEETIFSNEIMQNLLHQDDAQTIYRYENGYNEIICTSTRERKPIKIPGGSLTIAIVLAIICSFLIGFLPQDVQNILITDVVTPTLSTLLSLIVTVTIFMIFFSILSGICSIESGMTLVNIGSTVLTRFLLIDLGIIALSILVSQNFFPIESLGGENSMQVSTITELLLSIIPKNIPAAFMDKNILQVAIMASFAGICIIAINNRIPNVKIMVHELNYLFFKILETVFKVIPLIIFLCILKTLYVNKLSDFFVVWKLIVASLIVYAIIIFLFSINLSFKSVNILDFTKKILPIITISFITGNSSATLPKSLEISKESLHIDEKLCNFWIPLALVLFSPSKLIQLTMAGFYVVAVSGEIISAMEFILIVFLAIQLSVATPNAGGGIVASFSILLTELGLPTEYIGSLVIADVITGNLFTALNSFIRESELVLVANKLNFVKKEV